MKKIKKWFFVFAFLLATLLIVAPQLFGEISIRNVFNLASFFFSQTLTVEQVRENYRSGKTKILIVPGHEEYSGGTTFGSLNERELNVALANYLSDFFEQGNEIEVLNVKGKNGLYADWFKNYVKINKDDVENFRKNSQIKFNEALLSGFEIKTPVIHNQATDETSINLYAINKYANENKIDLVLHIHFNDYPRKNARSPGQYRGFTIYAPEDQLPNSKVSLEIAENIKRRLENYVAKSNYPPEKEGIVKSQDLIAIGSNASRDGGSVLIEYGYIYEPQIRSKETRDKYIEELAFQTYLGIKDYLNGSISQDNATSLLPHKWENNLDMNQISHNTLALQVAMKKEGLYPPAGKTLKDCRISGIFGPCTQKSLVSFQEKYKEDILFPIGLSSGTGIIGPLTVKKLNELYGF